MDVKAVSQGGQINNNYGDNSVEQNQSMKINNINQDTSYKTSEDKNSDNGAISVNDAKKAAEKINKLLEDKSTHIEYDQDERFKQVLIMKVVDNNTHAVIKEIPSKQILDMVAQFCEMAGLILDKKA